MVAASVTASTAAGFASRKHAQRRATSNQGSSGFPVNTAVKLHLLNNWSSSTKDAPVVVLVHGLDSWSATWNSTVEELSRRGIGSVSVDLRGHGLSPLGSPEDFCPRQLATDIRVTLQHARILQGGSQRMVLVGHSMGGKVVMRYASDFPEDLVALVIEDMDCTLRAYPSDYLSPTHEELDRKRRFDRAFSSWQACREALISFGYAADRVDGWVKEDPPRVFAHGDAGRVWSAINPHAQWLARRTILSHQDGYEALQNIAAFTCKHRNFPVHVLVAGQKGTVCDWGATPGGIRDMESLLPEIQVTEFPKSGHTIHRDELMAFVDLIEQLVHSGK